ncbi:methyltransferase, FxLD system [Kitasatospora aureofaciens]|uniref:methyltransferase, FxLD system n=1 Tax=Kitasatospora aureofaciens TaxID=1894 RepID=UPI0037CC398E
MTEHMPAPATLPGHRIAALEPPPAVPGRSLHGAVHPPEEQRRIFHRIGQLAAAIHHSASARPGGGAPAALAKLERHLAGARELLAPGDEGYIRAVVKSAEHLPPLDAVPTHGDLQLRNLRWDTDRGSLYVIDFERSEPGPAIRDFVRLSDAWNGRPDLHEALTAGYGRPLTAAEEQHLAVHEVLDAVSGIQYGACNGDPEPVERGRRTLARLRTPPRVTTPTLRSSTVATAPADHWEQIYRDGIEFRPLGEDERALLAEHAPALEGGGRALDIGCGTGELAAHLAKAGFQVDAVDLAEAALERARTAHPDAAAVRWLRLDVEHDDLAPLGDDPYDVITLRLSVASVASRTNLLHALGRRLRPGGTVAITTPLAASTPADRRSIALDEDEIAALTSGWKNASRFDTGDLALLVLRGPFADTVATERTVPATGNVAVAGSLAVVTNDRGQVLLGWSARGMWELPGGKLDGPKAPDEAPEALEAAAVRELAEETGLRATGATVLAILTDAAQGVPRLTAVTRVTGFTGTPAVLEPHKFTRWEWFDTPSLACLGRVFTPAAQALESVWPGSIPGLPPVTAYPHDTAHPAAPGESPEAARRRTGMTDRIAAANPSLPAEILAALRTVPRHRFAPEQDLAAAYDDDLAVITRRDETGRATSSVSAPWLQADMIAKLGLEPGADVLEVGSGGYNAELLAHVVGEEGRVVTVDIDEYVVRRTRRFTAEAGSGRVLALQGDGALGAPARHVPRGGFDGCVITHNVWDIAPAWRQQLREGATLVAPLEVHGYTRAIALVRRGDVLHARGWTYCGFVRDLGQNGRTTPVVDLAGGELRLRFEDGPAGDTTGLEEALRGERHEARTGVTVAGGESFETLQLYLATTLPSFCRLAGDRDKDTGIATFDRSGNTPALLGDGSLAYLTYVWVKDGETPAERRAEFVAHAFGESGPALADRLAAAVRRWDEHVRGHGYPRMTVHPSTTPDSVLPAGHVVDKVLSRLVFHWGT